MILILAFALTHGLADAIDELNRVSPLILLGMGVVGSIVGVVAWIDRRIDARMIPIENDMKVLRFNQRRLGEEQGVPMVTSIDEIEPTPYPAERRRYRRRRND